MTQTLEAAILTAMSPEKEAAYEREKAKEALKERRAELWVRIYCQEHTISAARGEPTSWNEGNADKALAAFDARFLPPAPPEAAP